MSAFASPPLITNGRCVKDCNRGAQRALMACNFLPRLHRR